MTALSDFHEVLRLILGDTDPDEVYDYSDSDLDGSIRSIFRLGRAPYGYTLASDQISPDIPDGNDYARIAYEAALLLVGGDQGATNYRTRALSVSTSGDRKKGLIEELRLKIYDIEGGARPFESYQAMTLWLASMQTPTDLVEVRVDAPLTEIDITGDGVVN